jgi:hypothetical protein
MPDRGCDFIRLRTWRVVAAAKVSFPRMRFGVVCNHGHDRKRLGPLFMWAIAVRMCISLPITTRNLPPNTPLFVRGRIVKARVDRTRLALHVNACYLQIIVLVVARDQFAADRAIRGRLSERLSRPVFIRAFIR